MSRNKRITVLLDKECPIDAGNPISHRSPYDIITLPRPIASRKSHRRLQQISRRNRTRLGNRFNFQILQKTRSISLRILKRPQMAIEQTSSTSRLHDDALEQTIVHRRDTLRQRACGPCGLAEHGNVRRITTKQGNIVLYPLNAHPLVKKSEIRTRPSINRFLFQHGMREKTKHIQPISNGDHHHALTGQLLSIELLLTGRSSLKRSTVKPYHHRQPMTIATGIRTNLGTTAASTQGRRPDIQIQTILSHRSVSVNLPFPAVELIRAGQRLHRHRREITGFEHAIPRFSRLWLTPA
ncbi:hypothetical protein LMG10733_0463 [Bifidobacterium adolescentis]|nr:hypothetical protein LMG10733_0463 [Bifidobacterium adolescentis]SPU23581.1 Uncharacterised protein [Bifidobacterium adolescentis]